MKTHSLTPRVKKVVFKKNPPQAIPFTKSTLEELNSIYKLTDEFISLPAGLTEEELRVALVKTFGSIEKGYGCLIALRNTLRSVRNGKC
jgi:hypothetical protein